MKNFTDIQKEQLANAVIAEFQDALESKDFTVVSELLNQLMVNDHNIESLLLSLDESTSEEIKDSEYECKYYKVEVKDFFGSVEERKATYDALIQYIEEDSVFSKMEGRDDHYSFLETHLEIYVIDKPNLGGSWVKINNYIFDTDEIYSLFLSN